MVWGKIQVFFQISLAQLNLKMKEIFDERFIVTYGVLLSVCIKNSYSQKVNECFKSTRKTTEQALEFAPVNNNIKLYLFEQ